jgi:hypothetical protein
VFNDRSVRDDAAPPFAWLWKLLGSQNKAQGATMLPFM